MRQKVTQEEVEGMRAKKLPKISLSGNDESCRAKDTFHLILLMNVG